MRDKNTTMHESYDRQDDVTGSSDRSFCYTFGVVALLSAGISFWKGGNLWPYLCGGAVVFAGVGLLAPQLFAPFNRLWFKIGMLLHKITTPLIMGIVFFGALTPTAILMRLFGKQTLDLKYDPGAPSYWIKRKPPGPEPKSMPNQF